MLLWLHNQNICSATELSECVEVLLDFTSQAISPHPSPVRNWLLLHDLNCYIMLTVDLTSGGFYYAQYCFILATKSRHFKRNFVVATVNKLGNTRYQSH
jgi:hypothetical protein